MAVPTETVRAAAPLRAPAGAALGESDMQAFEHDAKIGLLATVNAEGLPHVSLITSIQARGPRALMFGQFTEGMSKAHLRVNPRAGFLVLSPGGEVWRGQAHWTGATRTGAEVELYNRKPMFRYNAYFGIHAVHYLDLVRLADREQLSVGRLAAAAYALRVARFISGRPGGREPAVVLNAWTERHLKRLKTLKFASWVGEDGYPVITSPVACRPADRRRLTLRPMGSGSDLAGLTEGQHVAVFGVNLDTESVLVRGRFAGWRRSVGIKAGVLNLDWVYNSMPPKPGQIHPVTPLEPVSFAHAGP